MTEMERWSDGERTGPCLPINLKTAVDRPQRAQRTQGIELGKGRVFTHKVNASVCSTACFSLRSLYCNSPSCSQAARKPVRAGLRKGIKTGKLKTGKWDVVLYSCLQSSCLPWFLSCGFAALCLLRLFAAEKLSPPVPSDGTCPLHAGGVIDASLSGGCPPEFVVRRPGVSPPPPANLPSKRWRDLILRVWRVDPLPCPSSLGGDLNSSFILHHFRQASSGPVCHGIALLLAHCLAARPLPPAYGLGDGAKPPKTGKTCLLSPPPALPGWGRNE